MVPHDLCAEYMRPSCEGPIPRRPNPVKQQMLPVEPWVIQLQTLLMRNVQIMLMHHQAHQLKVCYTSCSMVARGSGCWAHDETDMGRAELGTLVMICWQWSHN